MSEGTRHSLIKPTLQTPFHIDFEWWQDHDNNWRVFLKGFLCEDCKEVYKDSNGNRIVDWVDPQTAEVTQVDGILHCLITHCANQPDFITEKTTLVDSVFRYFIANGNEPKTVEEIAETIDKPAITILRTLTGPKVFKGIRPIKS